MNHYKSKLDALKIQFRVRLRMWCIFYAIYCNNVKGKIKKGSK